MGFFSSIGQVISNRDNFKAYEQRQADIEEQRKALAKKNPPSKEELEKAQKEGKVLIDIVDIMDTHSEDVAENTETATMLPQALVPMFALYGGGGLMAKFVLLPALEEYENTRYDFIKNNSDQFHKWAETIKTKNIPDISEYFDASFFQNKKSIEKLKNVNDADVQNIYKQAVKKLDDLASLKSVKSMPLKIALSAAVPLAALVVGFVGTTLWATKMQVNSSRIARWQSREQLEDPKYFVQYTPEQIEEAKKNLEAKEQENKGFSQKLFKKQNKASLIQVIKDNKAYKEWKKQDKDESKKVHRTLTPEELSEAQKDKEVIQRITRVINNKAEDYSENMEVAAETLIMGTPFLGAAVGGVVGAIINKLGFMDEFADRTMQKFAKNLDNFDKESVLGAYKELKNHKKGAPGGMKKSLNLLNRILNSENTKQVKTGTIDTFISYAKKLFTYAASSKGARNKAIALISGMATGIAGAFIGLKLQKSSARAGRYLAKRELEKDPQNFIGYDEEDFKQVQNIKGEKPSLGKRFKEYITFLPRVIGEYFEYQKYVKTTAVKNRALKEELVKLDVTDEQLTEAKNLQRKMFNTFEKVDDKSQEYSESVEAAVEIAKPAVQAAGFAALISPAVIAAVQIARGKLNGTIITDRISKFLANHTGFLKGKKADKYLDKVNANLKHVINDTKVTGTMDDNAAGIAEFIKGNIQNLKVSNLKNLLGKNLKPMIEGLDEEELSKLLNSNRITKVLFGKCDKKQALEILGNLEKILDNLPEEKLQKIIDSLGEEFVKDPQKVMQALQNPEGLRGIFLTKGLISIPAIAGASWAGLSLLATFAIESYLAKIQKEAGRLGVMKAMEELQDPLYYADIEVQNTPAALQTQEKTGIKENKYLR